VIVAAAAVALSALPSFVDHAQRWITHLGNVAAPLTGVVLADYVLVQRGRLDVPALFDPDGRYRYLHGVNAAALGAVAIAVGVYYAVPQSWLKVLWGLGVGAGAYLALRRLQSLAGGRQIVAEASRG
jgi:nucleobase:cation symporter-1, NCS1 family